MVWLLVATGVGMLVLLVRYLNKREREASAAIWAELRSIASPDDPQAWRTLLERHWDATLVEGLLAQTLPAVRLKTSPCEGLPPLGSSRIGGTPDLPDDLPWPDQMPLLAQIRLRDMPPAPGLRRTGYLWFFGDFAGECRVFWRDEDADLRPRHGPSRYGCCAISAQLYTDIPDSEDISDGPEVGDDQAEWLHCVRQYLHTGSELSDNTHWLLGYPDWIQSSGLSKGVRLLMQINSDPYPGMTFGDVGTIYFLISEDDLAAWRFDRVVVEHQCY